MLDWLSSTNSKTAKQIELNLLLDLRMVLGYKKIRSGFGLLKKILPYLILSLWKKSQIKENKLLIHINALFYPV